MDYEEFYKLEDIRVDTSILYNIEPAGNGTEYRESITSYMVRLAKVHNIKLGGLINGIIGPALKKKYLIRSAELGGNRFFDGAKALNGLSSNSLDIVNVLEHLTMRKDLMGLTLQTWNPIMTNRGLLKASLSWCPKCISEFKDQLGFIYYPLLWFIKPVGCCLKHELMLVEKCQRCKNKIPILHRSGENGICPNCKEDLSLAKPVLINESNYEEESYREDSIGKLIAFAESLEYNLDKDIIKTKLNQINKYYQNRYQNSIGKIVGIPKVTFYNWLRGESIPTLEGILQLCFILKISLIDFYCGESIEPVVLPEKKMTNSRQIKRRKLDYVRIEEQLKSYLYNAIPKSMESIAKEIEICKRSLYRVFPEICKELSKKYQDEINLRSLRRKNQIIELINQSIKELEKKGKKVSQKNIESNLEISSLLRERFAKEYLNNYLISMD